MSLKANWAAGDTYTAADANLVAVAVNANTDAVAALSQAYDLAFVAFGISTVRAASSYGDFPFGVKLARAATFTQVVYRGYTADASGNLVVELRKNGVQISGTSKTIAAADQTAGGANATATGSWSCAAGDVITAYITAVGTTPGLGLAVDITGTA